MPTTGAILKAARDRAGLSQREVARNAFNDEDYQSLVSRYEADIVEPSLTNLRKLAGALDLSLGDFTDVSIESIALAEDPAAS